MISVFLTVTSALPLAQQTVRRQSTAEGRVFSNPRVLNASAAIWVSSIAAQRGASIDLGFAHPMCAVHWKDQSGQSLCSPENVGALPIVRVSTRGAAALAAAATCCRVSNRACSVGIKRVISASISALSSASTIVEVSEVLFRHRQNLSQWFVTLGSAPRLGI